MRPVSEGEVGTLVAQIAKLRGQIVETRLQIIAIDQNQFSDAQKSCARSRAASPSCKKKRLQLEDQRPRVELRAPIDGIIHELSVHTVGGVSQPCRTVDAGRSKRRFIVCRGSHPEFWISTS